MKYGREKVWAQAEKRIKLCNTIKALQKKGASQHLHYVFHVRYKSCKIRVFNIDKTSAI